MRSSRLCSPLSVLSRLRRSASPWCDPVAGSHACPSAQLFAASLKKHIEDVKVGLLSKCVYMCSRSARRRWASPASTGRAMVRPCARSSRRWRSRSTPSTSALSVARCGPVLGLCRHSALHAVLTLGAPTSRPQQLRHAKGTQPSGLATRTQLSHAARARQLTTSRHTHEQRWRCEDLCVVDAVPWHSGSQVARRAGYSISSWCLEALRVTHGLQARCQQGSTVWCMLASTSTSTRPRKHAMSKLRNCCCI